ncbi:MAG: DNA repair protein RadC [Verrucomicrobia bacterium]|nr:DNA repair protein RadC [Verrucomicrobiota bacterium]
MRHATIQELPSRERPREKLLARGIDSLTDAEILAILLRTGVSGKNAIALAQELLAQYGSLTQLARAPAPQLAKHHGVGQAKAVQLSAAFGLGARLASEKASGGTLDTPELIYQLLWQEFRLLDRESLRVVLLDTRYRLIAVREVSRGTVNESLAHPREIFKPAITHSAYAFVLAHNHPSGDPSPSEADLRLTRKVGDAARLLQIQMLDHLICGAASNGKPGYFSFKEAGLLG